jgi:hypothetical protein
LLFGQAVVVLLLVVVVDVADVDVVVAPVAKLADEADGEAKVAVFGAVVVTSCGVAILRSLKV